MKLDLSFVFLFILFANLTYQTQVTVTCVECSASVNNCKKIKTDTGYEITTSKNCALNYKRVYGVSQCQQARLSCLSDICYMEQRSCLVNQSASSCANPATTNYICAACSTITALVCSKSCWSLGDILSTTCTDSCSQISGAQQIDEACSGGVDSSGNTCACCRRNTVFKPSILGTCADMSDDLNDAEFLAWAKINVGSGLNFISAVLPVLMFALILSFTL